MNRLTTEQKIEIIREVAAEIGGKVRENYSGRGMFGKICFGIIYRDVQTIIEEAAERGLKGASQDNMGLDYIVYWPSVSKDSARIPAEKG